MNKISLKEIALNLAIPVSKVVARYNKLYSCKVKSALKKIEDTEADALYNSLVNGVSFETPKRGRPKKQRGKVVNARAVKEEVKPKMPKVKLKPISYDNFDRDKARLEVMTMPLSEKAQRIAKILFKD